VERCKVSGSEQSGRRNRGHQGTKPGEDSTSLRKSDCALQQWQANRVALSPSGIELELIVASGWKEFPPRLAGQPIFYPVTNEAYATQIARDWNVKESRAGFVTKFDVDAFFLSRYQVHKLGGIESCLSRAAGVGQWAVDRLACRRPAVRTVRTAVTRPILSGNSAAIQRVKWSNLGKILDNAEPINLGPSGG
jgi:hypothetical protein